MASRSIGSGSALPYSRARAAGRLALLILLFLVCAPLHLVNKWMVGRSNWPRRFLAAAAHVIGVRSRTEGSPIAPHTLLIVNHTSWLDILVLGGALNCRFVSKDNLGHGFVHWLADQNGTIYVRRSHRKGARDQAVTIAEALEQPNPVALFPEGTTGPGTRLLPFRSTLLEAANFTSRDVIVRPVAIDFGPNRAEVGWFEEPGSDNVLRILGRPGTLPVTVKILPPLGADHRKGLAQQAALAIGEALGFKSAAHSPIGGAR